MSKIFVTIPINHDHPWYNPELKCFTRGENTAWGQVDGTFSHWFKIPTGCLLDSHINRINDFITSALNEGNYEEIKNIQIIGGPFPLKVEKFISEEDFSKKLLSVEEVTEYINTNYLWDNDNTHFS
jgi:hypothetical protein